MAVHPTVSAMIQHPYGVLSKYTDPDGQTYDGVYANAVNSMIPSFQGHFNLFIDKILLEAAANERAKEWIYIDTFMQSIADLKDYKLYEDLKILCDELRKPLVEKTIITNFSRIIDTIQKIKTGLYDINKTLVENEKTFEEFNKLAATNPISEALRNSLQATGSLTNLVFGSIDLAHTSGKDIINSAVKKYKDQVQESIEKNNFTDKQITILLQLVDVFQVKLEEFYENKLTSVTSDPLNRSLQNLEQDIKLYDSKLPKSAKKLMETKKGNPKSISQVVWDTLNGSLGGKGIEYIIDLSGGGKNTGAILNSKGLSIDADNIQLASAELKYHFDQSEDLFTKTNTNIYFDDFKSDLEKLDDLERRFILMTSAKDQSTNSAFKKFYASGTDVKIKGVAALNSRATEIEEMYNTIGNVGHNPRDLIFSIANLATDFVCEGKVEQAKRTLGAICVAWMFDDAKEIIQGTSFIPGSHSLHFYNLNGKYYTLSDILEKTAEDLNRKSLNEYASRDGMKYVKITMEIPKTNPYEAMLKRKNQPPEGMGQWEEVSNVLTSTTKIGVYMNVANLFKDLFPA